MLTSGTPHGAAAEDHPPDLRRGRLHPRPRMRLLDVRGRGARGVRRGGGFSVRAAEAKKTANPGAPNALLNSNAMHAPALDPEWCAGKAPRLSRGSPPATPRRPAPRRCTVPRTPPTPRPSPATGGSLPRGAAGLLPGGAG